jgi:hypothetical protein
MLCRLQCSPRVQPRWELASKDAARHSSYFPHTDGAPFQLILRMDDQSKELLNALRLRFSPVFSDEDFRAPGIILLRKLPPEIAHTYPDTLERIVRDQPPFRMPNGIPIKWEKTVGVGLKFPVPAEIERIRQVFIDGLEGSVDTSNIVRPTPWLTTPFPYAQTTEDARETYASLRQRFPSGVILSLVKSLALVEQQPKGQNAWAGIFKFRRQGS